MSPNFFLNPKALNYPMHRSTTFILAATLQIALAPLVYSQDLLQAEESAFHQAVARASVAVVHIETFGGGGRVGEELIAEGPTTGTIVDADGWIISSLFSFRGQPASILVSLPGGKRAAAQIVARDFSRELVLLKVEVDNLPAAAFVPRDELRVGQWAIALGKTYAAESVSQSVGIVSALGRAYGKAVQTDAKVSPINYGGPLIDLSGRVIGILSPLSPGSFLEGESTELYDSGIGFAIPMQDILSRLDRMRGGQDIHSGRLGIVSSDQNELAGPVRLTGAAPGSPAAKAGVKAGDTIVQAAGTPVHLLANLRHALGPVDAGEEFEFAVLRDRQRIELQCVLAEEIPVYRRRYLGLRLRNLPPTQPDASVEIAAIEESSPAAMSTLRAGQHILACNDRLNPSLAELRSMLAVAELDRPLKLLVREPTDDERQFEVEILPATWPTAIAESLPATEAAIDGDVESTLSDVTLGDFPNKAYLVAPPPMADRELGLLMLFPEPGDLDRAKTLSHWGDFCRDWGWLVVVVNSGRPRAWSEEEVELASRVLGKMENAYALDKNRIVVAGLGIGGRIALLAAASQAERISAVLTLGTDLGRISLRQPNMPMQSLDFLLVGEQEKLLKSAEILSASGYSAIALAAPGFATDKWDSFPLEAIQRWLEGLGRY